MFPKKHIHKKPIIPTVTVKSAAMMCPCVIAPEEEPSSALIPLSYIINIGTSIVATSLQPSFFGKTRIQAYWHEILFLLCHPIPGNYDNDFSGRG